MKFIERFVITRRSYSSELKQMEAKKKDLAITTPDHSVNVIKAEDSDQNQDIISVSSEEDAMPPAETKPLLISDATLKETNGEKNGTKRIIVDEYSKLLETIVRLNSQSISIMAPEESIQEGTNSAMADACGVFVSQMLQRFKNESAQVGTIVEIIRILGEGLKKI